MATSQTKRAINKMKKAGYARREFRVRTERKEGSHQGRRYVEYGDAIISIRSDHTKEEEHARIPQLLAAGINVTVYILNNDAGWIHVDDMYTGKNTGMLTVRKL